MKLYDFLEKTLVSSPNFAEAELGAQIVESAYSTSNLLQNMGQVTTDRLDYRQVYVSHPSISDVMEDGVIPDSTVQSYATHSNDFQKTATSIEMTNEVLNFAEYDIEANTAQLVGTVLADKIAQIVVADVNARIDPVQTPDVNEQVRTVYSGISGSWGTDIGATYQLFAEALKLIPDTYDTTTKVFMNKNNMTDFISLVTGAFDQVWLFQSGRLLGLYEVVVVDQLDDNTILLGDLNSAFDVVSLPNNQTVDQYSKPDVLKVTATNQHANVAKDLNAVVVMKAAVVPTP